MVVSSILSHCNRGIWLMAGIIANQNWSKSEQGPVKIAHSGNFSQVVTDSGREALILFYSPMCRYCQAIAPVWEELGSKLQHEDVDIIQFDASANELNSNVYTIDGVPTIYWKYATKSKRPIKYDGGRDLQDFIKYVSEKAAKELSGWDRNGRPK